jgi:hypothetical protein
MPRGSPPRHFTDWHGEYPGVVRHPPIFLTFKRPGRFLDLVESRGPEAAHGAHLAEQVVDAGEAWVTELSTDELKDLFRLRESDS